MIGKWLGRREARRLSTVIPVTLAMLALLTPQVSGSPSLTVQAISWDVIGLDSNDQDVGPDIFPVGARACNIGTAPATNVSAEFVWDSPNPHISGSGLSVLNNGTLADGACTDFYFNVSIDRTSDAFGTARSYHIEVIADGLGPVSTPTPRQLFVEDLVSQARNSIEAITGPGGIGDPPATTVYVGETYTYQLHGSTAPNGYEQLEVFIDFPNVIFQVLSVDASFTSGGSFDTVYADACTWDPDPASATYLSCTSTGKAGGDIVLTYVVKILSTGSATVNGLIYDFSGNSYHYNSDFGDESITITASVPPTTSTTTTTAPSTTTTTAPSTTAPSTTTTSTLIASGAVSTLPLTGPSPNVPGVVSLALGLLLLGVGLLSTRRTDRS